MGELTHIGPDGTPRMVDVSAKPETARRALAEAVVRMRPEVLETLLAAAGPKGDALVVARLAGLNAAKRTPDLIPLAHPLPIEAMDLTFDSDETTLTIRAEVRATARTGVEMEALTAVAVAALTIYDMTKALQRDMVVERIRLLEKDGGQSGSFRAGP